MRKPLPKGFHRRSEHKVSATLTESALEALSTMMKLIPNQGKSNIICWALEYMAEHAPYGFDADKQPLSPPQGRRRSRP